MDFDQTQVLDLDDYLEDTEEEEDGISRLPVGYIKVLKFRGFPETSFPVYEGDNLIGRDDKCNITIPTKPVSKQHACIEIRDGTHLIYDCNSRNRTKRNKVFLKPQVRYELQNEDQLIFADVKCQYLLGTYKDEADDKNSDTGSETGSESMLPESNEDLELEKKSKIVTSSPKHEKGLDESLENKVIEPTQDCRSKDSGIVSPVFCAETDSETDEEKDASKPGEEKEPGPTLLYSSQDNREAEKVDSSFVDDQTQQYSRENTGDNNCNMDATLPATLVIEPDIIPTTPGVFAAVDEDKTSGVLKRAVEVRCDPFKRVSTGNTLDYGLETLETPNFNRESVDTSGDDNKRNDFSLVKSSENVNSDLVSVEKAKDDEMETVDNSKTLKETLRNEDVILDDLMATQSYEARNIPESPVSEDEAPFVKHDEDTMPEQDSLGATQAYAAGGNSLSGEASEDMATQAYGIFDEICASDEETETDANNATQAYGLDSDNFTLVEETGDEVATLAYEHVDSDSALPGDKGGGKVRQPAVVHAQQQGCMQDKELKKDNEELTLFDEFDGQSTQVYSTEVGSQSPGVNLISPVIKINVLDNGDQRKKQRSKVTFADNSDSESGACTKRDTKSVRTDESSDSAELPSLASLGISTGMEKEATDNEEDFALPARRSSRIRTPSKRHAAESTSSSARKSPSTVIEGENSLNSLKRCYVECASENGTSQANKMAKVGSPEIGTNEKVNSRASRGRSKTRGRSRKSVATKRGKKGTGKRETDEVVGEELVELDKKEEFKDDNSKDQEKELIITTSGDKRRNSENTKSKLNELVGEEMKEEETGIKVEEIKKKNNKKNENKEMANENIDEKEYKGQGVTLNDEDNLKGSGKKCIGRGRKKSAIQQGVRFRKGKLQDSEEKITPEETGRVSEKDESNERLDMVISETKGAAMPDLDVGDVMDVDGRPGHEGIKQDEKDNRRPVSTKDTNTHDFDATTKESKYGRVKKAGKGKIKNGESNQEDVKKVAGKRRNTGTRGRVRKEIKTEDTVSENERLEAGPKGRMVKREIAARVDAEYNIEVKERKDDKEESKKKGRTGGKKARKEKDSEEDIFKFDDHDSESTPTACSTTKSKVLQLSSASSACGKKSSSRTGRQDKVNEEKLTQHESAEFSESFLAPEMPVSSSQRSRRSSTSSEASSQGTPSRGRQRGKRSPAASSSVGSSPFKKTKLDPEPSSNIRVLFTGLASEAQARKIVEDLRGEVVDSVYECTHLVTDKVRRTVKFLCALSRGIPVVDKRWLQASKKSKSFIDCSTFTVKDKATEKQYDFSLNRSLEMAQAKGLLEGYTIHVTPHVVPKPEYMKDIIKCAKGEFAPKMPTSFSDHVLVVSCDEDKNLCQNAVGHVHTSELLLTGILRQQLDLEQYPCHFLRNVNV